MMLKNKSKSERYGLKMQLNALLKMLSNQQDLSIKVLQKFILNLKRYGLLGSKWKKIQLKLLKWRWINLAKKYLSFNIQNISGKNSIKVMKHWKF
jgi:hypothetical protein